MPVKAGDSYLEVHAKASANFKQELKKEVTPGLEGVASSTKKAFSALLATGAVAFIAKAGGATKDWGAKVRILTRELGVSTQAASHLAFAGRQVGLEVEQLSSSFGLFSRKLAANNTGLEKFGIVVRDSHGALRPFEQILGDVATLFAKMPDGPEKTALALQLFGRQGKALIPLLNQGADGLKRFAQQADNLGFTLTPGLQKKLTEAKKAQRDFSAALKGFQIEVGAKTLPITTKFTEALGFLARHLHDIPAPVVAIGAATVAAAGGIGTFSEGLVNTSQAVKLVGGWLGRGVKWFKNLRGAKIIDTTATIASTVATEAETVALEANTGALIKNAGARGRGRFGGLGANLPTIGKAAGIAGAAYAIGTIPTAGRAEQQRAFTQQQRQILELNKFTDLQLRKQGYRVEAIRREAAEIMRGANVSRTSMALASGATETFDNSLQKVLKSVFRFAGKSGHQLTLWAQETGRNFADLDGVFQNIAASGATSADAILKGFRDQLASLRDYKTNWQKLVDRGAPEELLTHLQSLGLNGAAAVKALAGASKTKFEEITKSMRAVRVTGDEIAFSLGQVKKALNDLPNQKTINLQLVESHVRREQREGGITGHTGGLITRHGVIPKFHAGGEVDIRALIGEGVVNRRGMARIGVDGLAAINRGAVPGTTFNVNVTIPGAIVSGSPEEWARKLAQPLRAELVKIGIRNGGTDKAFRR